jgi:DNA-binding XRE family transcriptional regulator
MNIEEIGFSIQQRRKEIALKQEDLSEMTGISSKTIYAIENGKGNTSLHNIQKIAGVLGLEIIIQIKKKTE